MPHHHGDNAMQGTPEVNEIKCSMLQFPSLREVKLSNAIREVGNPIKASVWVRCIITY